MRRDLRVCATDIDEYMKANLLVPFGMSSSGYVWNADVRGPCGTATRLEGNADPDKDESDRDGCGTVCIVGCSAHDTDGLREVPHRSNQPEEEAIAFRLTQREPR